MADTSSHVRPAITPSKRPRPVISCFECRRKKLKCDRTHPCQQCVKTGRPGRCEYQAGQEPELNAAYSAAVGIANKRPRLELEDPVVGDSPSDVRETSHEQPRRRSHVSSPAAGGRGVIEDLQERVARLEHALRSQDQPHSESDRSAISSRHLRHPLASRSFVDEDEADPAVQAKTKTKPQFPDACMFLQKLHDSSGNADMANLRIQLQCLHRAFEMAGHERHNGPGSTGLLLTSPDQRRLHLPPFHVCEKLAIHYFDNLEHCFRILHWPEFRVQLKLFFTDGLGEKACGFGFIPQLVGVLAIAASFGTHPECDAVTSYPILQRAMALGFMTDFLRGLRERQRYLLPALQAKMLVLMFKWVVMDPIDELFRLNGELLRDALMMKMDRDPSMLLPGVSIFQAELRRRCWMTIVECDLMLSILGKLPCMVPPYTTKPPQNVNDDELFEGMDVLPPCRPLEEWTDGLCQYVLSQSYPRRLSACKQMDSSGPSSVKFQDVLLHTRYLERVLQELPPPLRFSYIGDQASKTPPRLMARMELDISIRRPLMHLYSCCASAPNADDIQQEARAGFLQSCLMLTTFQDLFDPQFSEINVPRPEGYWDFFYNVYRYELGQAILGLCLEIKRVGCARATEGSGWTTNSDNNLHPASATSTSTTTTSASAPLNSTTLPMPYTPANIIDNVKDLFDPMKRRLLRPGASFKDVVYFVVVFTSVLPLPSLTDQHQPGLPRPQPRLKEKERETLIRQALQGLVHDCRSQLDQERVPIPSAHELLTMTRNRNPNRNRNQNLNFEHRSTTGTPTATATAASHSPSYPHPSKAVELGPRIDPTWADFPDLDFDFDLLELAASGTASVSVEPIHIRPVNRLTD